MTTDDTAEVDSVPTALSLLPELVLEGWLMKRSRRLHAWHVRWVSLKAGPGHNHTLVTSADFCSRQATESFDVAQIAGAKVVGYDYFGRESCFLLRYDVRTWSNGYRHIAFQAKDDAERDRWVTFLNRVAAEVSAAQAKARAEAEARAAAKAAAAAAKEKGEEPGGKAKGKGKCKGPAAPPHPPGGDANGKAKGKGIGKGKDKGKGKGKGKPALPFGRKLAMAEAAQDEDAKDEGTIFYGLMKSKRASGDIRALDNMFTEKASLGATPRPRQWKKKEAGSVTERTLLPLSVAQNFAIVVRGLPKWGDALNKALQDLDIDTFDQQHLERLAEVLPRGDQLQILTSDTGPFETLRDVEKQMIPMCVIPRLEQRIRVMKVSAMIDASRSILMRELRSVQAACEELRNSNVLRSVLAAILVMFNYINYGGSALGQGCAGVKIFDVASLTRLREFKTPKGSFAGFNGLHFVIMKLITAGDMELRREVLTKELPHLKHASNAELLAVKSGIGVLEVERKFLQDEYQKHADAYGGVVEPPKEVPPELVPASVSPVPEEEEEEEQDEELVIPAISSNAELAHHKFERKRWITAPIRFVAGVSRNVLGPQGNIGKAHAQKLFVKPPSHAPPPAMLQLADADNSDGAGTQWQEVFVEVLAPGTLCYAQQKDSTRFKYVVLAGATLAPLRSPSASKEGKKQAAEHPYGIEVVTPMPNQMLSTFSSRPRFWIDPGESKLAKYWFVKLIKMATSPGVGYLNVRQGQGIWRRRWAVFHDDAEVADIVADREARRVSIGAKGTDAPDSKAPENSARVLAWYRDPGEFLQGRLPVGGVVLKKGVLINSFSMASCSKEGQRLRKSHPHGFEVRDLTNAKEVKSERQFFAAESVAEKERWEKIVSGRSDPADLAAKNTEPLTDLADFIGIDPVGSMQEMPEIGNLDEFLGSELGDLGSQFSMISSNEGASSTDSRSSIGTSLDESAFEGEVLESEPSESTGRLEGLTADSGDGISSEEGEATGEAAAAEEEEFEDLPIHRLLKVRNRTEMVIDELHASFEETLRDIKQIIAFFGQKVKDTSPAGIANQGKALLNEFSKFSISFQEAIMEITNKQQVAHRKKKKDPLELFRKHPHRKSVALLRVVDPVNEDDEEAAAASEGEGEAQAEGEGEAQAEGEGEAQAEGEGEAQAEGEGEAEAEGEGEAEAETKSREVDAPVRAEPTAEVCAAATPQDADAAGHQI